MKRDRTGEVIEDELDIEEYRPHRCVDGWRGDDEQGRPIPCFECRPALRDRLARNRRLLHP